MVFLAGQKQVLRQLLADGGTTGHDMALLQVLFESRLDAIPVKPFVIGKLGIFSSNQRPLQIGRNLGVWHPFLPQLGLWVVFLQFGQLLVHEGTGRGVMAAPVDDVTENPQVVQHNGGHQDRHDLEKDASIRPALLAAYW
jgi:hypothetical protein